MWNYLDEMNRNLLYKYFDLLSGKEKQINYTKDKDNEDLDDIKCKDGFYLIWFLYRYILGCETLEQAWEHDHEEVLKKYKLYWSYLHKKRIYIGLNREILLYQPADVRVILEIVYKRYNVIQQIECFIVHTNETQRSNNNMRVKRAVELEKEYIRSYASMIMNIIRARKGKSEDEQI